MSLRSALIAMPLVAVALAGCAKNGDIDATGGVSVTRSACPAVAVPAYTGDVTLFSPPASRDADAINVVATLTNLRSSCNDSGENVVANATFDVIARRSRGDAAADIVLPYFATVMQGGKIVVSKSIGRVALHFNAGELRATTSGTANATINRAAATLSTEVRERITRKRKPGDADAAIDPMTDPAVRAAVERASFELLIGFQLTQDQLQYNATR